MMRMRGLRREAYPERGPDVIVGLRGSDSTAVLNGYKTSRNFESSASELPSGGAPLSVAHFEKEADAMLQRPARGDGAALVSARVRERREELESRERHCINIYVRDDADCDGESGQDEASISNALMRR